MTNETPAPVSSIQTSPESRSCGDSDGKNDTLSETVTHSITLHRTRTLPHGVILGYSDDFPDRQFLIVPTDKGPTDE